MSSLAVVLPVDDRAAAAIDYAGRGWPVFPVYPLIASGRCACGTLACGSPGKHPLGTLVPNGLRDATTDAATIRQWWAISPSAHVAIRTGAVSGIVALDVDADTGGWESAARLEAQHGDWPITPTVSTGGGGAHVYFSHPGGVVPNSARRIAPGIDVRGDGGYVIAPPSGHVSGTAYRWATDMSPDNVPLAVVPAWLPVTLMLPAATGQTRGARLVAEDVLAEGGRNDRLMRLGALLRRDGLSTEEIAAALHSVNAARCRPPLDRAEVEKIAASVSRYQPAAARRQFVTVRGGRVVTA